MEKELRLDKSDWQLVTLQEVVKEVRESTKDPIGDSVIHVVGLEHIDSEDIHLRRSAGIEESTTFTKKFSSGDVLFGRRRAYLKKAAQATFGGICSGDITVMRARDGQLLPELLPFLINNDKFFDYAVKHSAGGLSPRVKFKDLANYEFLLPPKDQQAQLAELLWAMDAVVERKREVLERLERTLATAIEHEIHGVELYGITIEKALQTLATKNPLGRLIQFGEIHKGKGIPKSEVQGSGIPCIRYGELYTKHHRVIRDFSSYIADSSRDKSFKLEKGDLIFAGSGETITEIGKSAAFVDDFEAYVGSDTLVFRPNDMNGYYLGYLMNSQLVRQQLNKLGTGATVMHIYKSDLEKVQIPIISREEQKRIVVLLEEISLNIKKIESQIISSQTLLRSLINQIF